MFDAEFFSFALPPVWKAKRVGDSSVILKDPRSALRMTMVGAYRLQPGIKPHVSAPAIAQVELQKWIGAQRFRDCRPTPVMSNTSEQSHSIAAAEWVDSGWNSGRHWFKRLFRRAPRLWLFWAVACPNGVVLVSATGSIAAMNTQRLELDRIITSVTLPRTEVLVGRQFANRVVSLARTLFPQAAVGVIDDGRVLFGSHTVSLTGLHQRYLAAPRDLPAHVQEYFSAVGEAESARGGSRQAWVQVRNLVLPALLTPQAIDAAFAAGRPLVHEDWVNDLSIGYVLDNDACEGGETTSWWNAEPPQQRAVLLKDLAGWGVSVEEVHSQALRNLDRFSHEHAMEGHRAGGCTVLSTVATDRYNAARILLPELHGKLRPHLGATFYAAIPARDTLITFATREPSVMERMRKQIAADFSRSPCGLSPKLFLVTPDGIVGDEMPVDPF